MGNIAEALSFINSRRSNTRAWTGLMSHEKVSEYYNKKRRKKMWNEKHDKRPAIAFDEKREVQVIIDALNAYRYEHIPKDESVHNFDEFIRKIVDELDKCLDMFNKKEE